MVQKLLTSIYGRGHNRQPSCSVYKMGEGGSISMERDCKIRGVGSLSIPDYTIFSKRNAKNGLIYFPGVQGQGHVTLGLKNNLLRP